MLQVLLARMDQLETKIQYQSIELKTISDQLQSQTQQIQLLESALSVKLTSNKLSDNRISSTSVFTPRTCTEARDSGLPEFKESGMYWIDPDGLGIGDKPIYVYCNMTSGNLN